MREAADFSAGEDSSSCKALGKKTQRMTERNRHGKFGSPWRRKVVHKKHRDGF